MATKHPKLIAPPKNGKVITREAPSERTIGNFDDVNSPIINRAQFDILYGKTPEHSIRTREGRGGRTFKYIPHGYTTDRLNKAFGFAWSFQLLPISGNDRFMLQVYDEVTSGGTKTKIVRDVAVYGELTVYLYDDDMQLIATIVKGGMGSQRWEMGTEFGDALKGAESDAKKFAAKELGIGLDLYYDDDAAIEQHEIRKKQQEELAAEMEAFNAPEPTWTVKARNMRMAGKSSKAIVDALKNDDGITVTQAEVNRWTKE